MDMDYTYRGPIQQPLASGLRHVALQAHHLANQLQDLELKLRHLAAEANSLHVMILEVGYPSRDFTSRALMNYLSIGGSQWSGAISYWAASHIGEQCRTSCQETPCH
jgi:hypothetical protein